MLLSRSGKLLDFELLVRSVILHPPLDLERCLKSVRIEKGCHLCTMTIY
jgi:hypothetical protein